MQINRGKDDLYKDLVRKSDGKIVMRFHLDHRDGFYKAPFSNAKVRYAAPGSVIKSEDSTDKRFLYTNLQMERANKVLALHEALCHPSDEALKNAREIHGPCAVCLQSKPLAVTGSNPSYDRHEVPMPGEDLHMDVVYTNKTPYLFCMDAASGKFSMVRLHNKGSEHLRAGTSRPTSELWSNGSILAASNIAPAYRTSTRNPASVGCVEYVKLT